MIVSVKVVASNADESVNVFYETTVHAKLKSEFFFIEAKARKKFRTFMKRNNPEVFSELVMFKIT